MIKGDLIFDESYLLTIVIDARPALVFNEDAPNACAFRSALQSACEFMCVKYFTISRTQPARCSPIGAGSRSIIQLRYVAPIGQISSATTWKPSRR